jgi:retinol-binding protein 3
MQHRISGLLSAAKVLKLLAHNLHIVYIVSVDSPLAGRLIVGGIAHYSKRGIMQKIQFWFVTALMLSGIMIANSAAAQDVMPFGSPPVVLDSTTRAEMVADLAEAVAVNYVDAALAEQMAAALREQLANGAYDSYTDAAAFATALSNDLRAIYDDKHLSVAPLLLPPGMDANAPPPMPTAETMREQGRIGNFGFVAIERLLGNIGYLNLRTFAPLSIDDQPIARDAAAAAMNALAGSSAIIVDLRDNNGGDPRTVQFLLSYLFGDEPVHLNSIYNRVEGETTEFWTLADIPGERMPDVPVYVLTSSATFSAAEEFAYDLQTQQRATIVGEVTGGGANPVAGFPINGTLMATIPTGMAINPVTGTNWEGVGVQPDVAVAATEALKTAHLLALENLINSDAANAAYYAASLANVRATYEPADVDEALLERYVGNYNGLPIELRGGQLSFRGTLVAISETLFAAVDEAVQFQFDVAPDGVVLGVELVQPDGSRLYLARNL